MISAAYCQPATNRGTPSAVALLACYGIFPPIQKNRLPWRTTESALRPRGPSKTILVSMSELVVFVPSGCSICAWMPNVSWEMLSESRSSRPWVRFPDILGLVIVPFSNVGREMKIPS
jgi:hypothetical protein